VPDPSVLEQVLLLRGDNGLLPALAGEPPDRLDILPHRDAQVPQWGRVTRSTHSILDCAASGRGARETDRPQKDIYDRATTARS
jgi:hypothetical protein